jgi:hypothetical protein
MLTKTLRLIKYNLQATGLRLKKANSFHPLSSSRLVYCLESPYRPPSRRVSRGTLISKGRDQKQLTFLAGSKRMYLYVYSVIAEQKGKGISSLG